MSVLAQTHVFISYADETKEHVKFYDKEEARTFKDNCVRLMDEDAQSPFSDYFTVVSVVLA